MVVARKQVAAPLNCRQVQSARYYLGGSRNSHVKYFMKCSVLQETVEEKDLGVWICNNLKF